MERHCGSYCWVQEGQVDWYEAQAILGGEPKKLQIFAMRSMARAAPFIALTPTPPSKRFSKRMSWLSPILAGFRHAALRQPWAVNGLQKTYFSEHEVECTIQGISTIACFWD